MKNKIWDDNLIRTLVVAALLTPFAASSAYGGWSASIAQDNEWDDQGEHAADVSPKLAYKDGSLYTPPAIHPAHCSGADRW